MSYLITLHNYNFQRITTNTHRCRDKYNEYITKNINKYRDQYNWLGGHMVWNLSGPAPHRVEASVPSGYSGGWARDCPLTPGSL